MHQDFPDGFSIGNLTNQEKAALQMLLVGAGLEMLSQTVVDEIKFSDVPSNHLLGIYSMRLKHLPPSSKVRDNLEALVSSMSSFKGATIRFVITRNDAFKYLIFTNKKFNELLGYLESSPLK